MYADYIIRQLELSMQLTEHDANTNTICTVCFQCSQDRVYVIQKVFNCSMFLEVTSDICTFHSILGIIYEVCMHEGGRGVKEIHTPCIQGGLTHLSTYAKSPLLHAFCYIFICKVFLSYFVVFGDNFH